jgi:1-acyl-sn-glycerol-3-phosphate acyltransferase
MEIYFKEDCYTTPENQRKMQDKLFLNTRWYFIKKFFESILKSRKIAVKNAYGNREWANASFTFIKDVEDCGGRFEIRGLQNIKNLKEPVVYISNHMSTLETFVFPSILLMAGDVSFVVKESLTTNYLFGPVMRSTNPVVVDRKNPRKDFQTVMEKGKELLEKGTSVVIFPQASREKTVKPDTFNSLGIKLAKTSKVRVVPIAIKTDFWENGFPIKELGKIHRDLTIHMHFGSPMEITGNGKQEHAQIIQFIMENLEQWNAKA